MKLAIAMALVAATTAASSAYKNAETTTSFASVKVLKQECELVKNGVFIRDEARNVYLCRIGKGKFVQMTKEK